MLGTFTFSNPTKLYFGEDALEGLKTELPKYGRTVQLIYGGGSVKKTGSMTRSFRSCARAAKRSSRTAA